MKREVAQSSVEGIYAEEEYNETEQGFQPFFNLMPDAMVIVDRKGKFLAVNDRVEEISGFKREELVGKNFLKTKIITAKSKAILIKNLAKRMMGMNIRPYEIEALAKDGETIPCEINARKIEYEGKSADLVIFRDIRERKKAEKALRESEEKFRLTFENAKDAIFWADPETGSIINCNKGAESLLEKKRREIVGHHQTTLHPPRKAEDYAKMFKRHIEQKGTADDDAEVITKTGKIKPVHITASVTLVGGRLIIQGIFRDITDRKIMEEKLRQYSEHLEELVQQRTNELLESEKRYSVLVEEASDGVAILQDGKIVLSNKKVTEITGYSRDELIDFPFEKLVKIVDEKHRQPIMERYTRRLKGNAVPATQEIELVDKTGECVPIEIGGTLIHFQGRPAILIIVRDIRERKRMEEERLRLEKLAAIGKVATMVGHDLRNPLQSIENAAYYLHDELSRFSSSIPISPKTMEMLQVLNNSVDYADRVIRDLQDFSATKKPILNNTDVNTIVRETLSQVEAPENVKLIIQLGRLPEIKTDRDMIRRVFMNLTMNGIQAMGNGGMLKVSTKKRKDFVEISLEDAGTGISKENLKKLFTPFFTTKARGMGVGLAICKKFVDAHGGSIDVESEEGKGSTFTVKLPIK